MPVNPPRRNRLFERVEGIVADAGATVALTTADMLADLPPEDAERLRWLGVDRAELLGGERLQYWKMNGPEFAKAVEKLGLTPRAARMP